MNPASPARLEFEVLDRIGDVHAISRDARFFHHLIEQLPRRANEGLTDPVFLIAGLLPDENQRRVLGSRSEDRLRGAPPQVAGPAARGCLPRVGQRGAGRKPLGGMTPFGALRGNRHLAFTAAVAVEPQLDQRERIIGRARDEARDVPRPATAQ